MRKPVFVFLAMLLFSLSQNGMAQETLNYGELSYFELSSTNEIDSFTFDFNGTPGEKIVLRMIEQPGSNLQNQLTLYDPAGVVMNSTWTNEPIIEFTPNLPSVGTYKIHVQSFGGEETGAYALFLQRSVNPVGARPLEEYGVVFTDTLDVLGDLHAFTLNYSGFSGESIYFRLYEVLSTTFQPQLYIFDPNGNLIFGTWDQEFIEANLELSIAGEYTIWISSLSGNSTGEYKLYMQNSIQPERAKEVKDYGIFLVDTIQTRQEVLTYSFNYDGNIGEKVLFRMFEKAPSNLQPQMVMFDPSGNTLINTWDQVGVSQSVQMPATGNYTFWLMTLSGNTAGEFYFYMQRSVESGKAMLISESKTLVNTLTFPGEIHTYEIRIPEANGDNLQINMAEKAPANLQPQITIFSPSGTQLASTWDQASVTVNVAADEPGDYTLWAHTLNNELTGAYDLIIDLPEPELDSIPDLFLVEDVPNDQGGWVNVHFTRSSFDTDGAKFDRTASPESYSVEINDGAGWTTAATAVAYAEDYYTILVPTTKDSNSESNGMIDFRVVAGMEEGNYMSNVKSGYSVDNLHPSAPAQLVAEVAVGQRIKLNWKAELDEDFKHFRILRSEDGEPFKLLDTSIDTAYVDEEVEKFQTYYYAVTAIDHAGNESGRSNIVSLAITSISDVNQMPVNYALYQNFPNPFNPATKIRYDLKKAGQVLIHIYNINGQQVATLVDENMNAGSHEVEFNGNNLPSGVYYYSIKSGNYSKIRKMILVK